MSRCFGEQARTLPDAEITRGREPEDRRGDPDAQRPEARGGGFHEPVDHFRLRLGGLPAVDLRRDAVRGEAHIVEHDLVEPGPGGRLGDVDVVVPHARVVRVRPGEPGLRPPDVPAGRPDREVGPALGELGVLEHDHPSDQVDAGSFRLLRHLACVVVVLRSAHPARQRHGRTDEADLAVLVLDVELDRVQPAALERQVRVELSGQRGQGGRHVDAADLPRRLRRGRRRGGGALRRLRRRRGRLSLFVAGDEARVHRERNDHADEDDKDRQPAEAPPPPGLPSALAKLVARIETTRKDGRVVMHSEP